MPNWKFYVERKFNYYTQWVQAECTQAKWQSRAVGFAFPLQNYLILNGAEFFDEDSQGSYDFFLEEKCKGSKDFMKDFLNSEYGLVKTAEKMQHALEESENDLSAIDDKILLELYKQFLDVHLLIFSLAFLRPENCLEKRVKEELLKLPAVSEINLDEVFKSIAVNKADDLENLDYIEEPIALLKIAALAKQEKKHLKKDRAWFDEKIDAHAKRYDWMKNPFAYEIERTSKEQYFDRLEQFIKDDAVFKLKKIQDERKVNEFNVEMSIRTFGIIGEAFRYVKFLRETIYLRTYATEATDRLYFTARTTLLQELANRLEIEESDLAALTGDEIVAWLDEGKSIEKETIEQRKKSFAVIWENREVKMFYGQEAEKVFEKYKDLLQTSSKDGKVTKIEGQVAFQGETVVARAVVLKASDDVHRVKEGEIIVVTMTSPEFIMAMEKASAFVTDEGGITCHASIIAREMKKPCIIGTGNATRVIQDGDLLEVDTEKGIVRIK